MILVTGGTGFIGSYLVNSLIKNGKNVKLLVRNPDKAIKSFPCCEYAVGGVRDKSSLKKNLKM